MKGILLFSEQYGPCVAWACEELADEFDDYLNDGPYILYNVRSGERSSASVEGVKVEFFFGTLADPVKVRRLIEHFIISSKSNVTNEHISLEVREPYPV